MVEEKVTCPKCGSTLIAQVGNQEHCNACGLDFDIRWNPIADEAASR